MAAVPTHIRMPELLWRLQTTLHMTQKELGNLVGLSSRTIIRFYQRGGIFLPRQWATLAKALQKVDPALAEYCARMSGATIQQLVQGKVPALPSPVLAAPSPALAIPSPAPAVAPDARAMPSAPHMADSVVCAGAEAMQCTPTQMRTGLAAALERMIALGMSAEQTLEAMSPPAKAEKAAKTGKTK